MIVIGAPQQAPEEWLDTDDLEILPAPFGSPDRPGDAVGLQAKILYLKSGDSRKRRIFIAHIAHFRIRNKGASVFRLKRHHAVCMWHVKRPQDQSLQDAENDDIGGDPEPQNK